MKPQTNMCTHPHSFNYTSTGFHQHLVFACCLFDLQGEFSQKISQSCLPSNPRLVSSPFCCLSTTSKASSSSGWRWVVPQSSCTRTSMANLHRRNTLCSAPSTWLMESKCLVVSGHGDFDVGGFFFFLDSCLFVSHCVTKGTQRISSEEFKVSCAL